MNLLLPLAVALLLPSNATGIVAGVIPPAPHGAMRKCQTHDLPGYITVVDGEIVRDFRGAGRDTVDASTVLPATDDIMSVEVRCLRVRSSEKESGWALRSAILVVTKSGARKVSHAQLTELVEEQRLHLARTGRYAASLSELRFTETRTSLGIGLKVDDAGWSASVSFKDPAFTCRVAVGAALVADPERRPGVPVCVST